MKKKIWVTKGVLALTLALTVAASATGCSKKSSETAAAPASTEGTKTEAPATTEAAAETQSEKSEYARELKYRRMPTATSDLFECGVAPILEREGYTLTPVEITDSVQRELALSEDEIDFHVDANTAYLDNFNKEQGTDLTGVLEIPTIPTGIYSGTRTDLKDIADGDKIAFPNDPANEARALYLMETNGLLKMKEGITKSQYTLADIVENPYNLELIEMKGASIAGVRDDFAFIILRGSDAYNAKVDFNSALAREKEDSILAASRMQVAVNGVHKDEGWVKDLIAAYQSDEFKEYLKSTGDFWILPDYLKDDAAASEKNADAAGEIPGPDGNDNSISIGVTPVPHAEIVNDVVKKKLEDAGWKLEVVEFNDYVQPNTALDDGELDANYFQTIRYLEEQNEERGLHLKEVAGIHLEPMGLYAANAKTLADLPDGASIAIPNDGSNESRAIKLLADNDLITLSETDDLYNLQNIAENPHKFEFVELEAANLPRSLDDVDAAVINGNYALEANLNPQTDALVAELADSDESYKYINYLVVKEGNEETAKTKALIAALENDDVKKYIEENYSGSVIPAF
jgi:D-methionine transport system substrate-binding protein